MIRSITERPDLAGLVARWRVEAFFGEGTMTVERMTSLILEPISTPKETFVLFDGGEPVGTAGLVPRDLETRPDLTPWLAGVFVLPAFRGRGHASALVRRVEGFARERGVETLWLYTLKAEGLYAGLGWERVGMEWDQGYEVVLMRRLLDVVQA